jgi:signal transduction histidine kinase
LQGDRRGVTLAYRLPARPIEAGADANRLRQALANVLLNAVKFTPSGGHVDVCLDGARGAATITVRDTGPGIPEDELPHVFERFYRGPSTANLVGGSGLGLPIVQSIMHAHGGEVEIRSEPGHGTEVILSLPAP